MQNKEKNVFPCSSVFFRNQLEYFKFEEFGHKLRIFCEICATLYL